MFDVVEVRALCRPVKFFHTDLALGTGCCHAETGKGLPQTVATELEALSRMYVLYALRFPFTGTKGPSPSHEKHTHTIFPPPLNFSVGTMHSDR